MTETNKSVYIHAVKFNFLLKEIPPEIPLPTTYGLIGYYPFNGNCLDESGNNNNAYIRNTATLTTDRFNNPNSAYQLISSSSYLYVPNITITSVTFTEWVYLYALPTNPFSPYHALAIGNLISGIGSDSNKFRFTIMPTYSNGVFGYTEVFYTTINTLSQVSINKWFHVCMVHDSSIDENRLYINGILNGIITYNVDLSTTLILGGGYSRESRFNGKIDDIRIYNRALTTTEILNIYNYEK